MVKDLKTMIDKSEEDVRRTLKQVWKEQISINDGVTYLQLLFHQIANESKKKKLSDN